MNNNRRKQIIKSLEGMGTKQNTLYTNQEIIDHLIDLKQLWQKEFLKRSALKIFGIEIF